MSTAFIYPGLNGLLRKTDRRRFLHLPQVQRRLGQAQEILQDEFQIEIDYDLFLSGSKEEVYAVHNVNLAAVAICAIQVGVSECLAEKLEQPPDWVMGCSLGDLARSVFAGAYDFSAAIINHIQFTKHIDGIQRVGKNIGLSSSTQAKFNDADFAEFDRLQVDVSRLTPRFLNIGGRFEDLAQIEALAVLRGWNAQDILQYPAHSRYIRPYVLPVADRFSKVIVRPPEVCMYSSFSNQELTDPQVIREEFLLSITQTIHWSLAIETLVREKKVLRFVNVGPCRSLILMMRDIDKNIECVDALEILAV